MFRKSALDRVALGSGWFSWLVESMKMEPVGGVPHAISMGARRGLEKEHGGYNSSFGLHAFRHPEWVEPAQSVPDQGLQSR